MYDSMYVTHQYCTSTVLLSATFLTLVFVFIRRPQRRVRQYLQCRRLCRARRQPRLLPRHRGPVPFSCFFMCCRSVNHVFLVLCYINLATFCFSRSTRPRTRTSTSATSSASTKLDYAFRARCTCTRRAVPPRNARSCYDMR